MHIREEKHIEIVPEDLIVVHGGLLPLRAIVIDLVPELKGQPPESLRPPLLPGEDAAGGIEAMVCKHAPVAHQMVAVPCIPEYE